MKKDIVFPTEADFDFLTSDKSKWFEYDVYERNIKWDEKKVKKFWNLLYEIHKDGNGFQFTDYQFPPVIKDGFLGFKTSEIDTPVIFRNCTFWGEFRMSDLTFNNVVSFRDSLFLKSVAFENINFKKTVWWDFVDFSAGTLFNDVVFDGKCFFSKTKFTNTGFVDVNFNEKTFYDRSIIRKLSFKEVNFEACAFDRINMYDKGFNTYTNPPHLIFKRLDFKSTIKFIRIDFSNTTFSNCDLTNINLKKCNFNLKNNRVVLLGEGKDLIGDEEHYRALKRNFYDKKDWETSGYFYTSEMNVRKKRLLKEKKYFEWFIYWFYGFFGGYTQNFKRPLILFITFSFVIFPLIYFFSETSFLLEEKLKENIISSLQKSISNSLPLIKVNFEYKNWWLKSFQIVFSGILLTFTILGLRKRFKQ